MPELEKPLVRWLHLTDLHIGKGNESQATALASLLAFIVSIAKGEEFDLVLLTGDLAYSGSADEYLALEDKVIKPLMASPLCRAAKFVAVPGNHDIDCDVGYPPIWKSLGGPRQEKFFHLSEDGSRTRELRAKGFANYQAFVSRNGILSVDPTTKPAEVFLITGSSRDIAILSTVTAFFSDKDVGDRGLAPAPIHPIRTLTQSLSQDAQVIVLGHHPSDYFLPDSTSALHSLLVERSALYLHGHEHKICVKFGLHGLTALGFGAAYQASLDSVSTPTYRNSFSICELSDSLDIFVGYWDAQHGQWRPDHQLPGDFINKSDRLDDAYQLPLPTTRIGGRSRPYSDLASAIREDAGIEKCLWLVEDSQKRWAMLLNDCRVVRGVETAYSLRAKSLPVGHVEFRVKTSEGQCLVHAVSAHGDILSFDQLQEINTELDRQGYTQCVVATLGELSSEANTLAVQLASRKPITILQRSDLVRLCLRNLPQSLEAAIVAASAEESISGCLIFTQESYALLLQERVQRDWFQVIDYTGEVVAESSALVGSVRREQPTLRSCRYKGEPLSEAVRDARQSGAVIFDRSEYLDKCFKYFDDVKYAPLAALGFRFRKASLSEFYVEASADVGGVSKDNQGLTRAIVEFCEALKLPTAQQQQLEAQMRSQYGTNRTAEVGVARKLYQRHNNVVVLGDPGSGKTCFVQYEILAYCQPPAESKTWYSKHLPVYVSLAEAARLIDDETSLLDACSIVSARRGIDLPRSAIDAALADGQAALFFDGLDEVGYIDKRVALLAEIDALFKTYAIRGNRFVLSSRPAAVQPVDIPDDLTYLQLRGLTEEEIRVLAARVLTSRLGDGDHSALNGDEADLVERLIDDTRAEPGIARIARNPLLLTLLVLIYANSGALSARRHIIYTQAIKTLVSVRGRQTRYQQISEADLRTRLGALALAIFMREIAEIPRRTEVITLLSPLMSGAISGAQTSVAEVTNDFIQEVAEATGILAIHARQDGSAEELVTFMHFSFLEYYAAAGLLSKDYLSEVPKLASNPRWRDVITLLFGMLSEQGDVTPLLSKIIASATREDAISQYLTLLAMDSAAECDVPPERAQAILASTIFEAISSGAGRYCYGLRVELAARLDALLQVAGNTVERPIVQGLRSQDPISVAAFADVVARLDADTVLSAEMVAAFNIALEHSNPVTRAAALYAIENRLEFRGKEAKECVEQSLDGSVLEKHAALRVIAAVPAFGKELQSRVKELVDDSNPLIAVMASQCLLTSSLRDRDGSTPVFMDKLLSKLDQGSSEQTGLEVKGITLDKNLIRELVDSQDPLVAELALRNISLMKDDDKFVHDTLIRKLRGGEHSRITSACLNAFRASAGAIDLITIADTDLICEQLQAPQRNIRISAAMLLGEMPDDEQVIRSLQNHLMGLEQKASQQDEVTATAQALGKHVRRNTALRVDTLSKLLARIPASAESGFGDTENQRHTLAVLSVCEAIGGISDNRAAASLKRLADDYRTPMEIRCSSIRVYGKILEPTEDAIVKITEMLRRNDVRMNEATYDAVASFVMQCRRRVEYVRRVYRHLEGLRDALCDAWDREFRRSPESINPPGLSNIRDAVSEVSALMVSYAEFSDRAKVA